MRIISGTYKGCILKGFQINGTRPTMDRVKESLFASIQNKISGSICLDLFAGSGSLGIEALSNGAQSCHFVDNNKEAIQTIQNNLKKINIQETTILHNKNYGQALAYFYQKGITFDIIFLDPPYAKYFIQDCINQIQQYQLLNEGGIIICEYEKEQFNSDYPCIKEKKYGDIYIKIYERES